MGRDALISAIRKLPFDARPFVCDGFPDGCDVVLVGENPATEMGVMWSTFWDDKTGFDFRRFLDVYVKGREERDERTKVSLTRSRVTRLRTLGLRCLETNVYANARKHGAGRTPIENYLLPTLLEQSIGRRVLLVHGRKAERAFARRFFGSAHKPIYIKHLSKFSNEEIDQLGCDILAGNCDRWSRQH